MGVFPSASVVIAQADFFSSEANDADADFVSATPGAGATGLQFPSDLNSNGSQFLIADAGNHRVLIHDVFPTAIQRPADQVIGQSDFAHFTLNDDDQDGTPDGPTERTLNHPTGVLSSGNRLIVVDSGNERVLIYDL